MSFAHRTQKILAFQRKVLTTQVPDCGRVRGTLRGPFREAFLEYVGCAHPAVPLFRLRGRVKGSTGNRAGEGTRVASWLVPSTFIPRLSSIYYFYYRQFYIVIAVQIKYAWLQKYCKYHIFLPRLIAPVASQASKSSKFSFCIRLIVVLVKFSCIEWHNRKMPD